MATTIARVYETKVGQRDICYRAWLSAVNFCSLMNAGTGIYQHGTLTAEQMRRWYLEGLDPYTALKRIQRLR